MKIFKQITTLILMLFSAFLFSCEKDNNITNEMNIENLYGKWILSSADFDGKDNYDDLDYLGWYMEFYKDGNYYGHGFGEFGNGTYNVNVNDWTVTTYVDGEFYLRYNIEMLSKDYINATISDKVGNKVKVIAKKIIE